MKKTYVKITNKKHPNYSEKGIVLVNENGKVTIKKIGRVKMFEIVLEDCKHSADGCFVEQKDVELI